MTAAAGPPAFPWDQAMRLGLGLLRLSPEAFWAMTPRELDFAARAMVPARPQPPARPALAALMRQFPDQEGR
ncbi:MAG: rcc01693 family protein [Pseudomonadota bacterium]